MEAVVEQGDVGSLFGYGGARAERQTYVGVVEGRGVIGAVARHGHHLTVSLQHLHETLLVGGTGARHDPQGFAALIGLLIAEGCEVGSGDVPFCLFRLALCGPDTYLPGNLDGCG